jgi:thiopurine S-methyltransferase
MDSDFWNNKYLENKTGWDIGEISTPLKEYIDQLENKDIKILIPGCGNAYEALYLWRMGFRNVFLIDIAPEVLKNFSAKHDYFPKDQMICGDFFDHKGEYDLIFEQTFFCALEPKLRPEYVKKMSGLLSKEGKLVGLLFKNNFEEGPPFGGDRNEYLAMFDEDFELIKMEESYNSIKPRSGAELFFMVKLKPN